MSNLERIQKFSDDQTKILVSSSKPNKINAEIEKLRTWLIKHQDEAITDGSKGNTNIIS